MPTFRRIGLEIKRKKETRQKKKKRIKNYYVRHPYERNIIFLKRVISRSYFHWKLIHSVNYEDYIWWSYANFTRNNKFEIFCHNVHLGKDNGLPKYIIKVVELINMNTYFNKEIRRFAWILTWRQGVFKYYNRYYRYLNNEKLFGKKKFLNYKNGHKLHLILCIKNRELTGLRLNKNHAFM